MLDAEIRELEEIVESVELCPDRPGRPADLDLVYQGFDLALQHADDLSCGRWVHYEKNPIEVPDRVDNAYTLRLTHPGRGPIAVSVRRLDSEHVMPEEKIRIWKRIHRTLRPARFGRHLPGDSELLQRFYLARRLGDVTADER